MMKRVRGTSMVEYAFLLVFGMLIVAGTAKLLGGKSTKPTTKAASTVSN